MKKGILENLNFQNSAFKNLPVDPIKINYIRQVKGCLSEVTPTPIISSKLVHYSNEALNLLDLVPKDTKDPNFIKYFSGNKLLPGSIPTSQCYCGHQFGVFAGQLGDGRAISLGDIINNKGERWELQMKGSGRTPYSRHADGRAVLRSSIREFLCSEAMHHLGVPTTRAATIITSNTLVERDKDYDGIVEYEQATIVMRLAPTFLRFGSFQIADPLDEETGHRGPSTGNKEIIKNLLDYTIKYHYPIIYNKYDSLEQRTVAFAEDLCWKTAKMVALWQSFGFTHGVMNTDNMSIVGLTIDYGPFAFIDNFNPDFVPNTTDKKGRYRFDNQSGVCKWNLKKLFNSIGAALPKVSFKLKEIAESFCSKYKELYLHQMRLKLGFLKSYPEDDELVESLLGIMHSCNSDFTNTFRSLSNYDVTENNNEVEKQPVLNEILSHTHGEKKFMDTYRALWVSWLNLYKARINKELNGVNDINKFSATRKYVMNHHNPRFILRNYMAQKAIENAEEGDYSEVHRLLDLLRDPYDDLGKYSNSGYDKTPLLGTTSKLSCSS